MAEADSTSSGFDPGVHQVRIRQLGGVLRFLVAAGEHDMAREVEDERDRLRRLLADAGAPAPMTVEDAVECLTVISGALTVPAPNGADHEVLMQRVEWTRTVVDAVLNGTQDLPFAIRFLAAQTARLQPAEAGG